MQSLKLSGGRERVLSKVSYISVSDPFTKMHERLDAAETVCVHLAQLAFWHSLGTRQTVDSS